MELRLYSFSFAKDAEPDTSGLSNSYSSLFGNTFKPSDCTNVVAPSLIKATTTLQMAGYDMNKLLGVNISENPIFVSF